MAHWKQICLRQHGNSINCSQHSALITHSAASVSVDVDDEDEDDDPDVIVSGDKSDCGRRSDVVVNSSKVDGDSNDGDDNGNDNGNDGGDDGNDCEDDGTNKGSIPAGNDANDDDDDGGGDNDGGADDDADVIVSEDM